MCRDFYRVEADSPKEAEDKLWQALRSHDKDAIYKNIELNDTIDSAPTLDYTVQLSPEGEPIFWLSTSPNNSTTLKQYVEHVQNGTTTK